MKAIMTDETGSIQDGMALVVMLVALIMFCLLLWAAGILNLDLTWMSAFCG